MTQEHPITPPGELVQKWVSQMITPEEGNLALDFDWLANKAARWGADQELEACCEWIYKLMDRGLEWSMDLRESRRPKPKPPSKEEALDELCISFDRGYLKKEAADIIRRALESLPD